MAIIPRMLVDLLSDSKAISLPECATQMFFFFGLGANNCFIMAAMSYDRYTAIHSPLRYKVLMTHKICFQFIMASWMAGFLVSLCIVITVFNLSFCDSNIIEHYFCDISPVVCLACDYTSHHEMAIFVLSAFVLVGSFVFIMMSYVFIVSRVVKMPSAKGKYKAFSTCSSHLTVVCIHYGFAGFVYLRSISALIFIPDDEAIFSPDGSFSESMTLAHASLPPGYGGKLSSPLVHSQVGLEARGADTITSHLTLPH
uniref:olfactory receptor 10Z1-like n=1 Tax=Panthera onca TaxID=9690 RepID=UPI0029545435|nr:olfactory receptor 10Z1-like [Panthera onca]